MTKLDLPIRPWVPQWLGIVTLFMVMLPIMMLNGAYTGSITEVSNTLGILSEDISMGYYATSAGMAVAYPIVPKIRSVITTKTLLLSDLFLQILISLFCAYTSNMDIIIACSFMIGFLKAFVMLELIIRIRPLFSPKNVRSEFYAYFYPIVFSGGQISIALTAQLAYYYQWQHMYYLVSILMMIAIVLILLFFRYTQRPTHIPYKEIDGKSILIIASGLLMTIYLFTYGKTLDWFDSSRLRIYAIIIPILIGLFIYRQQTSEKPYISLKPLSKHKSVIGYFFMIIVMFFTATSSLVTSYMNSIIRIDSVHANTLNLWLLPGFILGAILCFWWFRWQRWRFRFLIGGGMFCYVIYLGILYFYISPYSTYEMLYIPMVFRGLGMMILFIAFGVYVAEDLDPKVMLSNAFFLITFRSVLAPALSASFFSNMLYHLQLEGMDRLTDNMTLTNPIAASRYTQALNNALIQGHSFNEASQLASNNLYITLQQQSLLLGVKELFGYVLIGALAIALISCFIPFHKTIKVAVVKTGDDMV